MLHQLHENSDFKRQVNSYCLLTKKFGCNSKSLQRVRPGDFLIKPINALNSLVISISI